MNREEALEFVYDEIDHQIEKWGRKDGEWPDHELKKLAILFEEAGEVAMGINDHDYENVKQELAQVAAVCISWLMADFSSKAELAKNMVGVTEYKTVPHGHSAMPGGLK